MSNLEVTPDLLDALNEMATLLESNDVLERTLQNVVDLSAAVLPGCDAAGLTMRVHGKNKTAAASDDYARVVDTIQYDADQGPCLSAMEDSEFYWIDAVSQESRWPQFCEGAKAKGLGSSLSYPLNDTDSWAALNLYSKTERAFNEASIGLARVFAKQAAVGLHNVRMYVGARNLADQLNEALSTRDVIGQAKGILMEREGINDNDAFAMLKTTSQQTNMKLRHVAEKLVHEQRRGES